VKNPYTPKIPRARALIEHVLRWHVVDADAREKLNAALGLMTRTVNRKVHGPRQRYRITSDMRREIVRLGNDPSMTCTQIAERVGLPASCLGRVSEICGAAP
jgi:hypothetical protein